MAILGYDVIGTQWGNTYTTDNMFGSRHVAPVDGAANSITAALRRGSNNTPGLVNVRCLIYRVDDLSFVGVTETVACDLSTSAFGWFTFNFTTPPELSAGVEYWILANVDVPTGDTIRIAYDTGAELNKTGTYPLDFSLAPTNLPWINYANDASAGRLTSIYCTFSATGVHTVTLNSTPISGITITTDMGTVITPATIDMPSGNHQFIAETEIDV